MSFLGGSKESLLVLVSGGLTTGNDTGPTSCQKGDLPLMLYRRSNEFIRALKGIWTDDNFNFSGDFYQVSSSAPPRTIARVSISTLTMSVPQLQPPTEALPS